MVKVQSIYFAKDAIAEANEHGVAMIIRELRFSVYRGESFQTDRFLIDLDPKAKYSIDIDFIDYGTEESVYKIEGQLKIDPKRNKDLQKGFILNEPITGLPDATTNRFKVQVSVKDNYGVGPTEYTDLLALREAYPYGE